MGAMITQNFSRWDCFAAEVLESLQENRAIPQLPVRNGINTTVGWDLRPVRLLVRDEGPILRSVFFRPLLAFQASAYCFVPVDGSQAALCTILGINRHAKQRNTNKPN